MEAEAGRWTRLANHGMYLNARGNYAARRYAFSLASVSKHFEKHGINEMHELQKREFSGFLDREERRVYSRGSGPAPRGRRADAAMCDLILSCSFMDALVETGNLRKESAAPLKGAIWNAYENEARLPAISSLAGRAMDSLDRKVEGELALPINEAALAQDLERIFRGMEKEQDKDALTAMYGLRALQLTFLEGYRTTDHLAFFGAARQLANYFKLEKMAHLSRLGTALEMQDEALSAIEPFLMGEYAQFTSLLRTANSSGNFLSMGGNRGRLGLRLEALNGSDSLPIGSLEHGALALCMSYYMLTDDPLHAEMILRTFAPKFEMNGDLAGRAEPPYFAAFFDSTSEIRKPELRMFGTGERDEIIERWFAQARRKRTAAMN